MSRNLTREMTINDHHGVFVDPKDHIYMVDEYEELVPFFNPAAVTKCTVCRVEGITGPAIDRLHEFEKLGMEPEEIVDKIECLDRGRRDWQKKTGELTAENQKLKKEIVLLKDVEDDFHKMKRKNEALANYNNELCDDIAALKRAYNTLKECHADQVDAIADLEEEIKQLKKLANPDPFHLSECCDALRKDLDKAKAMIERRDKEIEELAKKNEELPAPIRNGRFLHNNMVYIPLKERNEDIVKQNEKIKELQEEIARLRAVKDADFLADCCDSLKIRVRDLEKKLELRRKEYSEKIMAMSKDVDDLQEENKILRAKADNTFRFGDGFHSGDHDYIQMYIDAEIATKEHLRKINNKLYLENDKLKKKLADIGEIVED